MTAFTIDIPELLNREIIRNDYPEEWLNKMTDKEIEQWNSEVYALCKTERDTEDTQALNACHLSKYIDRTILYTAFKLGDENNSRLRRTEARTSKTK
jgi:hypothetical protein